MATVKPRRSLTWFPGTAQTTVTRGATFAR